MKFFGLGWILRHWGIPGALIWLLIIASLGSLIGLYCARQAGPKSFRQGWPYSAIFGLYVFACWLLTFGIQ
jgi:hypothetical protein